MIVIMIVAISMAVTSISLTLQAQMYEKAQAYRQEVQINELSRFYEPVRNRADKLGLWPETKSELVDMAKILRDPALESVIEDSSSNPYSRYIGYSRSGQENSNFKVSRSVLYFVDPDILSHDEKTGGFLNEARNPCGGDYSTEEPWCPPVIANADADYTLYRSDASKRQRSLMVAQEAKLTRLRHKIVNSMSYQDSLLPGTSAVSADVQPLYDLLTTDAEGTIEARLSPNKESCDASKVYYWDGMPLTCRDIFSVWHVDTVGIDTEVNRGYEDGLISHNPSENPDLPSNSSELNDRLHSPIYVFDDGSDFFLYATTPYNRNGTNEPYYIYTDLSL